MDHTERGIALEAAQRELGISERALRAWLRSRPEIQLIPDPSDARRRLLDPRDMSVLRQIKLDRKARALMASPQGEPSDARYLTIAEHYGPLDAWAKEVFIAAIKIAGDAPLHTLHVIRGALTVAWPDSLSRGDTPQLDRLLSEKIRAAHDTALRAALVAQPPLQASAQDKSVTERLETCLRHARAHVPPARSVTFPAIAYEILTSDKDLPTLFACVEPDVAMPYAVLVGEIQRLAAPRGRERTGMDKDMIVPVLPSEDRRYAKRHHLLVFNLLRDLAQRQPTDLVVLWGMYGSPLTRVQFILADLFAERNFFVFGDKLGHLEKVFLVQMGALRAQGPEDAPQALREALQRSREEHAVLILDRFELLARNEPIDTAILRVLAQPADTKVIARFVQSYPDTPAPTNVFPNLSLRPVASEPYDKTHVTATIREHFAFADQGFPLSQNALDTLFTVEPFIAERGSRKTLPYLAVELIQECIETLSDVRARGTHSLLEGTALTALQTLDHLIGKGGETDKFEALLARTHKQAVENNDQKLRDVCDEWSGKFEGLFDALKSAHDELAVLRTTPTNILPTTETLRKGPIHLTRALINSHLFGSLTYEFKLVEYFARACGTFSE